MNLGLSSLSQLTQISQSEKPAAANIRQPSGPSVSVSEAATCLDQICRTYLERNEQGEFVIPVNRQRPIMFIGPAGIGKTDIPKQAAEKLGIGYVSYSITHHTRQSALGLPKIVDKEHEGEKKLTTEYTESEIISAVYDNGKKEGILFIDEVNCASETLSAPLLQLFQNKTLGQSKIPEGWILVMAGNPPEYNKSVKEFDAVTRDRLRIINIVPDADAWLAYADKRCLNSAVTSYISEDKSRIYGFDSAAAQVVTPRGWEELSISIDSYERHGFEVNQELISQFIGIPSVSAEFFDYYKMVKEYVSEKEIDGIISGDVSDKFIKSIQSCGYNIRYMLISCLKIRLHKFSGTDREGANMAMNNIVSFLEKAYKGGGEAELFMSGILSDPEIVTMTVSCHNEHFGKYLNEITGDERAIRAEIKKTVRKAAN